MPCMQAIPREQLLKPTDAPLRNRNSLFIAIGAQVPLSAISQVLESTWWTRKKRAVGWANNKTIDHGICLHPVPTYETN